MGEHILIGVVVLVLGVPVVMYLAFVVHYTRQGYPLTRKQQRRNVAYNVEHGYTTQQEAGDLLTAPRAARGRGAAYAAGAVTAFASGSYAGARMARNVHAVTTGRVLRRAVNIGIGRALVSRMWWR